MKKRNISRVLLKKALAIPAFVGLSLSSLSAASSLTWDNDPLTTGAQDGGGIWGSSGANWWDGTTNVLWSDAGFDVIFGSGGTAGNVIINSDNTGSGNGVRKVNSILFAPVAGGTYTIQSGRLSFSSNIANISAQNGTTGRITSTLRHTGDIYIGKAGSNGRIILTQSLSSLAGSVHIEGGALRLNSVANLSSGLLELKGGAATTDYAILESNGRLTRGLGSQAGNIRVTGGIVGFSAVGGKLTLTLGETITMGSTNWNSSHLILNGQGADGVVELRNNIVISGANRTIQVDSTAAGTEAILSGAVVGDASKTLDKTGLGTLVLSGPLNNENLFLNVKQGTVVLNKNSSLGVYAVLGITDIATGATVKIGDDATGGNQISNISKYGTQEDGSVFMSGGTLDLNGNSEGFYHLGKKTSANASSGLITNSGIGPVTLTLGDNSGTETGSEAHFKGVIEDGVGGMSLVKMGGSKQVLYGVNTYTGRTVINGGTLTLTATETINSASEFVLQKGTLEVTGTQTIRQLTSVSSATMSGTGTVIFDSATVSPVIVNARVNTTNVIAAANKTLVLTDALNAMSNLTIRAGATVVANSVAKETTIIGDGAKLELSMGTGLLEGKLSGNSNWTGANPGTAIKDRLTYGLTGISASQFGDNTTWAYTGILYLSEAKTLNFRKTFDDGVFLNIGGKEVIKETSHTADTKGSISLESGYYSLDIRFANGTGGVGPAERGSDFGLGYNTGTASDTYYEFLHDPTNGIYFLREGVMNKLRLGQNSEVFVNEMSYVRVTGLIDNASASPGDLIKTGRGILQLSVQGVAGYYTGATSVREGTLKLVDNVERLQTSAIDVSSGATLAFSISNNTKTFAKAITGTGTISVNAKNANTNATGVLTLSDLSAFTGDLIVEAGRLKINNATSGNITIWSGAQLEGSAGMSITGGTLIAGRTGTADKDIFGNVTLHNSSIIVGSKKGSIDTLTFDGKLTLDTSNIRIDLGSSGADKVVVNDLDVIGTGNRFILNFASNLDPTKLAIGNSYVLLHVNSTVTNASGLIMDTPRGTQLVYDSVNKDYVFSIIGKLGYVKWTGENSRIWDTTTSNWVNITDGLADQFHSNDFVLFDDSARYKSVTLSSDVTVYNLTVDSDMDYIFSGNHNISGSSLTKTGSGTAFFKNDGKLTFDVIDINEGTVSIDVSSGNTTVLNNSSNQATVISGNGTLDKSGAGTLVLWGNNTYGNTTISEGTLQIGNGGASGNLGRGNVSIAENAILAFNLSSVDNTIYGAISGKGSVVQKGTGSVILGNTNTYSGGTFIEQGTVNVTTFSGTLNGLISSSVGSGAVTFVNNTGTLSFAKAIGDGITLDPTSKSIDFSNETGTAIAYSSGTLNNEIILSTTGTGTAKLESGNAQNVSSSIVELDPSTGLNTTIAYTVSVWTTTRLGGKISGGNSSSILEIGSTEGVNGNGIIVLQNQDNDFIVDRVKITGGILEVSSDSVLGNESNQLELAVGSDANGGLAFGGEGVILGAGRNVIISAASVVNTRNYTGTIEGILSGTGALVKEGLGTLILTGNSTSFAGGLDIKNGTVQIGNGAAGVASSVGTGSIKLTGEDTSLIINSDTTTIANSITGVGSVIQDGIGDTTLTGANSYSGATVVKRGTLIIGSSGALSTKTSLNIQGGVLDLNGVSGTVSGLSGNAGGVITNNGGTPSVLTVNSGSDSIFGGSINDGNSSLALTKGGSGNLSLVGAHTYSGDTTVTDGILSLSADNALLNSNAIIVSGGSAVFSIGDTTQTFNNIKMTAGGSSFNMRNGADVTVLGTIDLSGAAGNVFINVDSGYRADEKAVLNGALVGTSGTTLVKDGSGTLVLNNTGSGFGGDVLISRGNLEVNTLSALGTGGLSISAGALVYSGGDATFSGFKAGAGLMNDESTISVTDAAATLTITGNLGGTGSLNKTGQGTLVIGTSSVAYDGFTRVNEGTLKMGTTGALPAGTLLIIDGTGTFDLNGNSSLNVGGLAGYSVSGTLTNSAATNAVLKIGSLGENNSYYGKITGNVTIQKEGEGILILSGKNTSTGDIILKEGILRANEGLGLSLDSSLVLLNGTLESRGRIVRDIGSGAGQITLGDASDPNAIIGFAAVDGRLIVNVGNSVGQDRKLLNWDPTSPATSDIHTKELVLGSVNATSIVDIRNSININASDAIINVVDNFKRMGDYAVISGSIQGSGGLIKEGAGMLVLTGNEVSGGNTYTGDTTINAGTLKLARNQVILASTNVNVGGDMIFDVSETEQTQVKTVLDIGSTTQELNSLNFSGSTQGGTLSLSDGGKLTAGVINVNIPTGQSGGLRYVSVTNGTAQLIGTIAGDATFVKNGEGTLIVQNGGSSGFSGGFYIEQGILQVSDFISLGSGNLKIGDATFRYVGPSVSTNLIGEWALQSANSTIEVVDKNTNLTITSTIGSISENGMNLVKTGAGTLTLAGVYTGSESIASGTTFNGNVVVKEGEVQLGADNTLPKTSAIDVSKGALFDLNGYSVEVTDLLGTGSIASNGTTQGTLTVNRGTNLPSDYEFAGTITGNLDLVKEGDGVLTLSGNNTYSGRTIVKDGVFRTEGRGLSSNTEVILQGGAMEFVKPTTAFTRRIGDGAGAIKWKDDNNPTNPVDVWFSASGGDQYTLTIALDGGKQLHWDDSRGFLIGNSRLVFGSSTQDSYINFTNALDLGSNSTVSRVIVAYENDDPNVVSDLSIMSGVISGSSGLIKTGNGTLRLANTSNTYSGPTTIMEGVLEVVRINDGYGFSSLGRVSPYAQNLVIDGGTLRYVGEGEYSDKRFSFGLGENGGTIESSGKIEADANGYITKTGAIRFDSEMEIALIGAGERTLTLGGSNKSTNELGNILRDNAGGATSILKVGDGKWYMSSELNDFSGSITVNGGWLKFFTSRSLGQTKEINIDGWATSYHEKNGGYVKLDVDPISEMNFLPLDLSFDKSSLSTWVKDGQIAVTTDNTLLYLQPGVQVYKSGNYSYFLESSSATTKQWAVYNSDKIALIDSSESSSVWSNLLAGGVQVYKNGKSSSSIESGDKMLMMDGGRLVAVDFSKTVFTTATGEVNPEDKSKVSFADGRQGFFNEGEISFYNANEVVLVSSAGTKTTLNANTIGTSGNELKANTMGDSIVDVRFDSGKLAYTATKVFYKNGSDTIEVEIDSSTGLITPTDGGTPLSFEEVAGKLFVEDGTAISVSTYEDALFTRFTSFIYQNETTGIWSVFDPTVGKEGYVNNTNTLTSGSNSDLKWTSQLNTISDGGSFTMGDQYLANQSAKITNGSISVNSDNKFVFTLDKSIDVVGTVNVTENGKTVQKDTYTSLSSIELDVHQMIALSEGRDVVLSNKIAAKLIDNQIVFRNIATLDAIGYKVEDQFVTWYESIDADLNVGDGTGIGAINVDSSVAQGSILLIEGVHSGGTLVKYGQGELRLGLTEIPEINKLTFNVQEGALTLYSDGRSGLYAGVSDLREGAVLTLIHRDGESLTYSGMFEKGKVHMTGGIIQINSGHIWADFVDLPSSVFTRREKLSELTGYGNIIGIYDPDISHAWEHSALEVESGYFAGTISDSSAKMHLIKSGTGTLVLYGNKINKAASDVDYIIGQGAGQTFVYRKGEDFANQNTYSGTTYLEGGVLSTFGDNVLSARSDMKIVASATDTGGVLKLNGFTQTVASLEMESLGNVNFTGGIDFGHGGLLIVENVMYLEGGTIIVGHNSGNVELDDGTRVFRLARNSAERINTVDSVVLTSRSLDEKGGILQVDSVSQITSVIDFGNGTGIVQIGRDRSETLGTTTAAKVIRVGEGKDVYFQSFEYAEERGRLEIQNMIKDGSGVFVLKKDRAITPILSQNAKIRIDDGTLRVANFSNYTDATGGYSQSEWEAMFTQDVAATVEITSGFVSRYNVLGEVYETVIGGTLDLNNTTQYIDTLVIDRYAKDQNGVETTSTTKARVRLGGKDGKLLWNATNSRINGGIIDLDNYSDYTHQDGAWFSEVDLGKGGILRINDLSYWGQQRFNLGDGTGQILIENSTENNISGAIVVDYANVEITLNDVFKFNDGLIHDFNLIDITKGGNGALVLGDNINIAGTGSITIEAGKLILAQTASVPGEEIVLDKTIVVKKDPYTTVASGVLVQRGSKAIRLMGTESNENLTIQIQKGNVILEKAEGLIAANNIYINPLAGESAVLQLAANDQIYDQGFVYMTGGVFDLNGKMEKIAGVISSDKSSVITNNATATGILRLGNTVAEDRNADTVDYFMGNILKGNGDVALIKEGEGTLYLGGDNTFSGGITITSGKLHVEKVSALGDDISSNLIKFIRDSKESSPTLSIYSNDTVVLKHNISIQGTGSAESENYISGLAVFDIGNKVIMEGQFIGEDVTAVLVKKGAGILELSDSTNESFNGTINVEAGTLIANRDVGLVDINVLDGAVLMGSGSTSSTMTVEKGGTLAPGNSVGHYSVGELELLEGSISKIEFDSMNSDQVTSLGDVVIAKGAIMELFTMVDVFENSTLYDVFIANGSVEAPINQAASMFEDPANGLTLKYDLAFFNPSVHYELDRVQVQMDRKSYAEFGKRKSEKHTGAALDQIHDGLLSGAITNADMRDVVANLAPLTNYQGHKALQALSGSIHAQGEQSRWMANERFRGQIENRINKFDPYDFETKESLWAHTFGYTGDTDDDNTNIGYDYKGAGIVGGYDYRTENYGVIGLAFYYEDGKAETSHETSKIDDFRLMAYISQEIDEWTLSGNISYGFQQYDTSRTIQYGMMDARKAKASYDGDVITLSGDVAYAFDENWSVIGGLDIERVSRDGFKEKDAGAAGLKGDSDDNIDLATRLGFRYTLDGLEDDAETRLYAQAFWKHRFNGDTDQLDASFIGAPGSDFSVESSKLKRDSFIIGLGFESLITDDVSWYGDANAEFSGSTTGFGGNVGIRYNW